MADEHDPRLSQQYRQLEPLEPPPALDQKILAAARQATESHAPLVAPGGRQRWYYPLAAAAVLVFAVALTIQLDRGRPDPEAMYAPSVRGEIKQAPKAEAPPPQAEPQRAPAPAPRAVERPRMRADQAAGAAAAARAQADAESRAARDTAATAKQQSAPARLMAAAPSAAPAAAPPENPERWLERIAELRSRGRHADADRELVAFRKAYPNYQLSNVMRERVEGTPTPSQ